MAKRDYTNERLNESPQRKEARNNRNKARRKMFNMLKAKHGEAIAKRMMDGKDVDHKKPVAQGGTNKTSNLRLRNSKENQSDKGTIFRGKKTTRPRNPRTQ